MSRLGFVLAWGLCLAPLAAGAQPAATETLERALNEQIEADEEARASQQRVDELDDETQKLLSEYRRALADAESYATYAEQLEAQVAVAERRDGRDRAAARSRSRRPRARSRR